MQMAVVFIAIYILLVGVLMYMNTNVLGLGDPKFGGQGWLFYWPLWGIMYSPAIVAILFFLPERNIANSQLMFSAALIIILLVLEISFFYDIGWQLLFLELVALIWAFIYIAKKGHV